jgi:hypothetical protein
MSLVEWNSADRSRRLDQADFSPSPGGYGGQAIGCTCRVRLCIWEALCVES